MSPQFRLQYIKIIHLMEMIELSKIILLVRLEDFTFENICTFNNFVIAYDDFVLWCGL